MARRLRYQPHNGFGPKRNNPHPGMGAFLLSEQSRDPAVAVAREVAAVAKATAPRSKGDGGARGHMADKYEVDGKTAPVVVKGNPRVGAEVRNSHPAAAPNEFGGKRNKRLRILGRAGALFGDMKGGE